MDLRVLLGPVHQLSPSDTQDLASASHAETAGQVFRFVLVGLANTGVYYVLYRLFLLAWPYLPSHLVAYGLSVVFSFFLSCWFTYRVRPTWRRFVLFPLSVLVNFLVVTFGTVVLVEWLTVPDRWAPLVATAVAIPFSFVAARFILTGKHNPDRVVAEAMQAG